MLLSDIIIPRLYIFFDSLIILPKSIALLISHHNPNSATP